MSWSTATLGEVCSVVSGATPSTSDKRFWDGEILWTTPKDLSDLETPYLDRPPRTITTEGLRSCSTSLLPVNSVLLSSRAPIGLVAINSAPMATNQGFKNLVPDNRKLDSKFLYYWLKSKTAYLQSLGNGATFKEISKTVVERIEIPLPPVDEQQRIAAILDKADALRRKRKRALDLLDSLGQSIFQAIFGEPSEYATRWKSACALGSLAEVVSGITKGRKLNGVKVREVPYLAVANVQDKYLNLSTVKKIEASEDEIRRYRVKVDDLLLTEGGDPDKLGRGTLWQNEINEIIHQNHIFRVRLSSQEVLPLFLNWLVGGSYGKSYFLRSAKQTTGIASINKQQLSAFPVVIPPRDLQIRFVQSMDAIADVTRVASSSLDASVKLFASLQHRAFSGQL